MRGEIRKGDTFSVSLRHLDVWREEFRNGIGQGNLTALDHIHQQQGSEYLGHGPDFKYGIAVDLAPITLRQAAVGDDPAAFGIDHSHYHTDALTISVDPVDEDFPNLGVGRGGWKRLSLPGQ